jgi:hypothetical protein
MLRNVFNLSLLAVPHAFASGVTRITDLIVPDVFSPYVQNLTEEKSRLVQSGAVVSDASLAVLLAGGGLTFNEPSFKDLDNDAENISTDDPSTDSSPNKIGTLQEIQVRMSRNNSWSSMDLAATLAGADPMAAIADRVAAYWTRRMQAAFIATLTGVFADNTANDSGDYTNDISGGAFIDGVTNFSAEAYLDAKVTMGDSMEALSMVMMHSIVYNRALKNNLIDFRPDSSNPEAAEIATFLGADVIVDDGVTNSSGVFHTWLFGAGAVRWGNGSAPVPTEVYRAPSTGNGAGQDVLHSRVEWIIHPVGHAYVGTAPNGGPTNAATSNNLAAAGSWDRRFPERKQIKIARLITREY